MAPMRSVPTVGGVNKVVGAAGMDVDGPGAACACPCACPCDGMGRRRLPRAGVAGAADEEDTGSGVRCAPAPPASLTGALALPPLTSGADACVGARDEAARVGSTQSWSAGARLSLTAASRLIASAISPPLQRTRQAGPQDATSRLLTMPVAAPAARLGMDDAQLSPACVWRGA
ncbi:hypothetical protein EON68_02750 [archaeon]|nr:MAG: hypothetical protein EON68_02750 [archaeon]